MKMNSSAISFRMKLILVVAMVLGFCLDSVKGGCLSYGHSCWGAHGKRSGPPRRPLARAGIPAAPIVPPPDGWATLERAKPPPSPMEDVGKGSPLNFGSKAYYPPLGRLIQLPPAGVLDLLGSDGLGSSENDIDPQKSNGGSTEDTDYGTVLRNHNGPVLSLGDRLARLQREQRRKAALFETAFPGTDTSGNSSNADDGDADFERFLLDTATKNSEDMPSKDFGRLINGNHRHRKYDRA